MLTLILTRTALTIPLLKVNLNTSYGCITSSIHTFTEEGLIQKLWFKKAGYKFYEYRITPKGVKYYKNSLHKHK
jgi:DNA-binding PadR family transcriptional regulator